ncbi:MAG: aspartate ammonia-lyase [Candidatus Anammoxibacter sp.]
MGSFRIEKDSMGEVKVPADAYYGAQTMRAIANFPISGIKPHIDFVYATVFIKKAAAIANMDTGCLDKKIGDAIVQAADRVIGGGFGDQFVVDVYQAGAGTSHHMNVNEVIANIAIEILGGKKGDYSVVSPNDHVNYGQSTNDVFPTAIRIAALLMSNKLFPVLDDIVSSFKAKSSEFDEILKSGRTHLQDAVPIRLGQEFSGYYQAISKATGKFKNAADSLKELGIGGSAVGTGVNAHPDYIAKIIGNLKDITCIDLKSSPNLFEAMQSNAPLLEVSGALRGLAVEFVRIANDLRLLSSGPNTGLGEINLPAVQPGSSIMPGKVNPVMAEMLNMVCFAVIGNDQTISSAVQAGQFELNVMMPVIQYKLLDSLNIFTNALRVFNEKCVKGITANADKCNHFAMNSVAIVTALNPFIGYLKAAEIAKESIKTGESIKDIALKKGVLSKEKLDEILSPMAMTEPRRLNS